MRELKAGELDNVSGGWWNAIVAAVFIYDAATDFVRGVQDGYNEAEQQAP